MTNPKTTYHVVQVAGKPPRRLPKALTDSPVRYFRRDSSGRFIESLDFPEELKRPRGGIIWPKGDQ